MENFHSFYLEYLGADDDFLKHGQMIFPSIYRVEPETSLSYMYHHLIVSEYNDQLIHSVAPALFPDYREIAPDGITNDLQQRIDDGFASVYKGKFYRMRRMYRYSADRTYPEDPKVITLTENDRELAMQRMSERGPIVKEKFWRTAMQPMLQQGRVLSILENGREVSRSNITDLPCGAVNIEIWTHPDHRRKGFGASLVKQAVNWCYQNRRIPVYLVHSYNEPSVYLAESIGLTRMAEEIQTVVIRY